MVGDKVVLNPVNSGQPLHASSSLLIDHPNCQEVYTYNAYYQLANVHDVASRYWSIVTPLEGTLLDSFVAFDYM